MFPRAFFKAGKKRFQATLHNPAKAYGVLTTELDVAIIGRWLQPFEKHEFVKISSES